MDAIEYGKRERACTKKQQAFVHHYVRYGNGADAVANSFGTKPGSRTNMAYKLLQNPDVVDFIEAVQEMYATETMVSVQMIVNELKNIMYLDPLQTFEERTDAKTGKPHFYVKDLASLKKVGPYIKSYKIHRKTGEIEVVLYDKVQAMEMLMKFAGGYEQDNKQKAVAASVQIYLPDNGRDPKPAEQ